MSYIPHGALQQSTNVKAIDAQMKGSNFRLGENKTGALQTTAQHNFTGPPSGFKAVQIDAATKADLRKSHWTFGGGHNNMTSTMGAAYRG